MSAAKVKIALKIFKFTRLSNIVELIQGDARLYLSNYSKIAFCFLDAEKEVYSDCYDLIIPRMVKGGFLIDDNAFNHKEALEPMLNYALNDKRIDAIIAPVGKGLLLCRRL